MKDKTRKDIIIIISYIALVIFALVNFSKIIAFLGKVISIFSPFLLGIILAFVLNVLNNFIEKKIFGKIKPSKIWNKIKRPLCITLSLILVFLTIFFVMNLLIPQLKNSASLFTDTLPAYKEDIIGILNKFDVDESTVNKVGEYLDNLVKLLLIILRVILRMLLLLLLRLLPRLLILLVKVLLLWYLLFI